MSEIAVAANKAFFGSLRRTACLSAQAGDFKTAKEILESKPMKSYIHSLRRLQTQAWSEQASRAVYPGDEETPVDEELRRFSSAIDYVNVGLGREPSLPKKRFIGFDGESAGSMYRTFPGLGGKSSSL